MSIRRETHDRHRLAGFTLIEMLVVLAVMAVTTAIAVQSLGPIEAEARQESTRQTLDQIANAVLSTRKATVGGFLADTGRLPVYASSISSAPYSVDELTGTYPATSTYGPPADLGYYQAVSVPMTIYTSATATASTTLTLHSGWNGPYILAPSGSYSAGSTTSIVDGWSQALPAFLYPDASHGNGLTIWSAGDPTAMPSSPVSTTLVPSALTASSVVFNGYNSSGVPASPTRGRAPYYYAVYGPAPISLFAAASTTLTAGGPYEVAAGTAAGANPAPAVYRYCAAYSPSYSLVDSSSTVSVPGPTCPGVGPRAFCILDSSGYIVSGPVYQVVLPGANTVNFLVQ